MKFHVLWGCLRPLTVQDLSRDKASSIAAAALTNPELGFWLSEAPSVGAH